MDPLSQAVIGATIASSASKKETLRTSITVGALSAMAADLDVLIQSSADHLLSIEYHRHFTHSLIFIPLGAFICAVILSFAFRVHWKSLYKASLIGYATAAPLDALTSYGTHLFWPFTDERTALNIISIVDPVYTLTVLCFLVIAFFKCSKKPLAWSIAFICFWHSLGFVQRARAEQILLNHASDKQLTVTRTWVQPSLGNLIIWRGLIETADKIYITGIRVGFEKSLVYGGVLDRYFSSKDKKLVGASMLDADIQRFKRFSSGFIAKTSPHLLTDARYSPIPWETSPLWALELDYDHQEKHARMKYFRDTRQLRLKEFWMAIKDQDVFLRATSKN